MQDFGKMIIITRQFIHLNFPKCASTWTEHAMENARWRRFCRRSIMGGFMFMLIRLIPATETSCRKVYKRLLNHEYDHIIIALNFRKMSFENHREFRPSTIKYTILQFMQIVLDKLFLINKKRDEAILILGQHLSYSELSDEFRQLPVLANIRDPFTWHTSHYSYHSMLNKNLPASHRHFYSGRFKDYLENRVTEEQNMIYQGYNQYLKNPQKNFHDIRDLCPKDKKDHIPPAKHFGLLTMIFIYHVLKEPAEVLFLPPKEFEDYWESGAYKTNIPSNIIWLQQANLRQDLYEALKKFDYRDSELKNIHKMDKILISQSNPKPLNHYYKKREELDLIYKLEKPLFILFPEYEKLYRETLMLYSSPSKKDK